MIRPVLVRLHRWAGLFMAGFAMLSVTGVTIWLQKRRARRARS